MAVRRGTGRSAPAKTSSAQKRRKRKSSGGRSSSWVVLFWLAFAIFIFGLFLFNREAIGRGIQILQNASRGISTETDPESAIDPDPGEQTAPASSPVSIAPPSASQPAASSTASETVLSNNPPALEQPASQTPEVSAPQNVQEQSDRVLYFTQVDRGGSILRVRVDRKLPSSGSPMTDVLQALIAGPDGAERQRGLISLIPPGTKMLSVSIRGNTAYISFSEEFQYNTYGVEGYAGQLRQIVFTATEFPNVRDVQILIEGRRVDYLGEGIWIGSPISREML